MHISDNVPVKGFLSIDKDTDTMYFDGNHLTDVLKEFYEQDIEITIKKPPSVKGKCTRLIELCDSRDENNNCLHTRLCAPVKDCFTCKWTVQYDTDEPCHSCQGFSKWVYNRGSI